MKNLLYKELKLCLHPLVIIFVFVSPLMAFIPNYPLAISLIYVATSYPILFLGANKGQQSNDIYFSCLLPVRRKDVIKARLLTLTLIQIVSFLLVTLFAFLATFIKLPPQEGVEINSLGLNFNAIISLCAFALISYSLYDFIFVVGFYKNGRAVVLPTLLGMLGFMIVLITLTVVLPSSLLSFYEFFTNNIIIQLIALLIGILIYIGMRFLTLFVATREFERVDF